MKEEWRGKVFHNGNLLAEVALLSTQPLSVSLRENRKLEVHQKVPLEDFQDRVVGNQTLGFHKYVESKNHVLSVGLFRLCDAQHDKNWDRFVNFLQNTTSVGLCTVSSVGSVVFFIPVTLKGSFLPPLPKKMSADGARYTYGVFKSRKADVVGSATGSDSEDLIEIVEPADMTDLSSTQRTKAPASRTISSSIGKHVCRPMSSHKENSGAASRKPKESSAKSKREFTHKNVHKEKDKVGRRPNKKLKSSLGYEEQDLWSSSQVLREYDVSRFIKDGLTQSGRGAKASNSEAVLPIVAPTGAGGVGILAHSDGSDVNVQSRHALRRGTAPNDMADMGAFRSVEDHPVLVIKPELWDTYSYPGADHGEAGEDLAGDGRDSSSGSTTPDSCVLPADISQKLVIDRSHVEKFRRCLLGNQDTLGAVFQSTSPGIHTADGSTTKHQSPDSQPRERRRNPDPGSLANTWRPGTSVSDITAAELHQDKLSRCWKEASSNERGRDLIQCSWTTYPHNQGMVRSEHKEASTQVDSDLLNKAISKNANGCGDRCCRNGTGACIKSGQVEFSESEAGSFLESETSKHTITKDTSGNIRHTGPGAEQYTTTSDGVIVTTGMANSAQRNSNAVSCSAADSTSEAHVEKSKEDEIMLSLLGKLQRLEENQETVCKATPMRMLSLSAFETLSDGLKVAQKLLTKSGYHNVELAVKFIAGVTSGLQGLPLETDEAVVQRFTVKDAQEVSDRIESTARIGISRMCPEWRICSEKRCRPMRWHRSRSRNEWRIKSRSRSNSRSSEGRDRRHSPTPERYVTYCHSRYTSNERTYGSYDWACEGSRANERFPKTIENRCSRLERLYDRPERSRDTPDVTGDISYKAGHVHVQTCKVNDWNSEISTDGGFWRTPPSGSKENTAHVCSHGADEETEWNPCQKRQPVSQPPTRDIRECRNKIHPHTSPSESGISIEAGTPVLPIANPSGNKLGLNIVGFEKANQDFEGKQEDKLIESSDLSRKERGANSSGREDCNPMSVNRTSEIEESDAVIYSNKTETPMEDANSTLLEGDKRKATDPADLLLAGSSGANETFILNSSDDAIAVICKRPTCTALGSVGTDMSKETAQIADIQRVSGARDLNINAPVDSSTCSGKNQKENKLSEQEVRENPPKPPAECLPNCSDLNETAAALEFTAVGPKKASAKKDEGHAGKKDKYLSSSEKPNNQARAKSSVKSKKQKESDAKGKRGKTQQDTTRKKEKKIKSAVKAEQNDATSEVPKKAQGNRKTEKKTKFGFELNSPNQRKMSLRVKKVELPVIPCASSTLETGDDESSQCELNHAFSKGLISKETMGKSENILPSQKVGMCEKVINECETEEEVSKQRGLAAARCQESTSECAAERPRHQENHTGSSPSVADIEMPAGMGVESMTDARFVDWITDNTLKMTKVDLLVESVRNHVNSSLHHSMQLLSERLLTLKKCKKLHSVSGGRGRKNLYDLMNEKLFRCLEGSNIACKSLKEIVNCHIALRERLQPDWPKVAETDEALEASGQLIDMWLSKLSSAKKSLLRAESSELTGNVFWMADDLLKRLEKKLQEIERLLNPKGQSTENEGAKSLHDAQLQKFSFPPSNSAKQEAEFSGCSEECNGERDETVAGGGENIEERANVMDCIGLEVVSQRETSRISSATHAQNKEIDKEIEKAVCYLEHTSDPSVDTSDRNGNNLTASKREVPEKLCPSQVTTVGVIEAGEHGAPAGCRDSDSELLAEASGDWKGSLVAGSSLSLADIKMPTGLSGKMTHSRFADWVANNTLKMTKIDLSIRNSLVYVRKTLYGSILCLKRRLRILNIQQNQQKRQTVGRRKSVRSLLRRLENMNTVCKSLRTVINAYYFLGDRLVTDWPKAGEISSNLKASRGILITSRHKLGIAMTCTVNETSELTEKVNCMIDDLLRKINQKVKEVDRLLYAPTGVEPLPAWNQSETIPHIVGLHGSSSECNSSKIMVQSFQLTLPDTSDARGGSVASLKAQQYTARPRLRGKDPGQINISGKPFKLPSDHQLKSMTERDFLVAIKAIAATVSVNLTDAPFVAWVLKNIGSCLQFHIGQIRRWLYNPKHRFKGDKMLKQIKKQSLKDLLGVSKVFRCLRLCASCRDYLHNHWPPTDKKTKTLQKCKNRLTKLNKGLGSMSLPTEQEFRNLRSECDLLRAALQDKLGEVEMIGTG